MTDGATADFVPYETGSNPHDPVDRAIAATMKAVFPRTGCWPALVIPAARAAGGAW